MAILIGNSSLAYTPKYLSKSSEFRFTCFSITIFSSYKICLTTLVGNLVLGKLLFCKNIMVLSLVRRSEERRVGKECGSGRLPDDSRKTELNLDGDNSV